MKKKFSNMSKREYLLIFVEAKEAHKVNLSLENLLMQSEEEFEYMYALNEEIDNILDLKVGENFFITTNRDNFNSKGVLTRIK